jgi:alginate O-acetyltransferase complex protein AlgI
MLFSSWPFLVYFLPVTLGTFYLLPAHWRTVRKLWLIAASFVFYGYWRLDYVPLLMASILANFGFAEWINRAGRRGKVVLTCGVAFNLLLLGYFKYTNFAVHVFAGATGRDPGHFNIILPLAISFFTFTQISYLVDVSRDHRVHYRFIDYFLFVVLFPHLIAGPIVRHWEIIPQFAGRDLRSNRDNFSIGFALFVLGLFKKSFADFAATGANTVYDGWGKGLAVSTQDAWLGTLAFSLQIYFDFSSYSDMAIGLAGMFGIKFPANFDSPYRATSIIVFWERWHRTLTRFLREYVYFTLGGNRRGHLRQIANIMATMLLSGLWHGAGWTFIIWGGLHGAMIVVNHEWRRLAERMRWTFTHWTCRAAGVLACFTAVTLAWTFFRAPSLSVALGMLGRMLGFHFNRASGLPLHHYGEMYGTIAALLSICWALPNTQQLLEKYDPILEPITRRPWFHLRLGLGTGLVLGFGFYLILRNSFILPPSPFIYFNF